MASAQTNPLHVETKKLEQKWSKNKLKTPQHVLEKKGIRAEAIEQEQRDISTRKILFVFLLILTSIIVPTLMSILLKSFQSINSFSMVVY